LSTVIGKNHVHFLNIGMIYIMHILLLNWVKYVFVLQVSVNFGISSSSKFYINLVLYF